MKPATPSHRSGTTRDAAASSGRAAHPSSGAPHFITRLKAAIRDKLPDILWPIYALGGVGIAALLVAVFHFSFAPGAL